MTLGFMSDTQETAEGSSFSVWQGVFFGCSAVGEAKHWDCPGLMLKLGLDLDTCHL